MTGHPYYTDDSVTLYHGLAEDVPMPDGAALVTDPPYPNNAGHFTDGILAAEEIISRSPASEAIIFWSELAPPPSTLPLVAVHIWHRTNVNGRPYEPAYHYALDGKKRRSEVLTSPAIFDGAGPGCREYLGHPTQKPLAVMQRLISKVTSPVIFDPFAGSGSTLAAAKFTGRTAVGVELDEAFCEIIARRLAQDTLFGGAA